MAKPVEESDGKANHELWLGGEAVVPRYPRRRQLNLRLTRSMTGLLALAAGIGFAGGLWIGLQACGRTRRPSGH
jgi:hypothetical protein